jgi:hypothetical protein
MCGARRGGSRHPRPSSRNRSRPKHVGFPVLGVPVQAQSRRLVQVQRPHAEEITVTSEEARAQRRLGFVWCHHGHTSVRPAGRPRRMRQPSSSALAGRGRRRGGHGGRVLEIRSRAGHSSEYSPASFRAPESGVLAVHSDLWDGSIPGIGSTTSRRKGCWNSSTTPFRSHKMPQTDSKSPARFQRIVLRMRYSLQLVAPMLLARLSRPRTAASPRRTKYLAWRAAELSPVVGSEPPEIAEAPAVCDGRHGRPFLD